MDSEMWQGRLSTHSFEAPPTHNGVCHSLAGLSVLRHAWTGPTSFLISW